MSAIDEEIKLAKKKLEELQTAKATAEAEDKRKRQLPLRALAEQAHDLLCRYNHTDGCSWGYEGDDWNAWSHQRWLDRIESICEDKKIPVEKLLEIMRILETAKAAHCDFFYILGQLQAT